MKYLLIYVSIIIASCASVPEVYKSGEVFSLDNAIKISRGMSTVAVLKLMQQSPLHQYKSENYLTWVWVDSSADLSGKDSVASVTFVNDVVDSVAVDSNGVSIYSQSPQLRKSANVHEKPTEQ